MTNDVPIHVQKKLWKNFEFLPVLHSFFWSRVYDTFSFFRGREELKLICEKKKNSRPYYLVLMESYRCKELNGIWILTIACQWAEKLKILWQKLGLSENPGKLENADFLALFAFFQRNDHLISMHSLSQLYKNCFGDKTIIF